MNHEFFSVSFRYALKYMNSFEISICQSRGVATCLNPGKYTEGVQR